MIGVLVSACLLGEPVRYDGRDLWVDSPVLGRWRREGRVVPFCPETAGGLPVPRPPAQIVGGDGAAVLRGEALVMMRDGKEVTGAFLDGAGKALQVCRENGVRLAVLTDRSPSCGSETIHDGGFDGALRAGFGVAAALLQANGISVFSQHRIEEADAYLRSLEPL